MNLMHRDDIDMIFMLYYCCIIITRLDVGRRNEWYRAQSLAAGTTRVARTGYELQIDIVYKGMARLLVESCWNWFQII